MTIVNVREVPREKVGATFGIRKEYRKHRSRDSSYATGIFIPAVPGKAPDQERPDHSSTAVWGISSCGGRGTQGATSAFSKWKFCGFFFFFVSKYIQALPRSPESQKERERKKKSRGSKMASRVVPTATPVCSLSALKSATGRGRPRRPDSPHHWRRNSRPLSALPSPVCRHGRFRSVLLVHCHLWRSWITTRCAAPAPPETRMYYNVLR